MEGRETAVMVDLRAAVRPTHHGPSEPDTRVTDLRGHALRRRRLEYKYS